MSNSTNKITQRHIYMINNKTRGQKTQSNKKAQEI